MAFDKMQSGRRIRMRFWVMIPALVFLLMAGLLDVQGYVFINLLLLIFAAICIVVAFLPSLSLRQRTGNISTELDSDGMAKEKINRLIQYIKGANERVYMVTGEFHPSVFNSRKLGETLRSAAKRGVDVRIIIGDRARNSEALRAHIANTNKQLLDEIRACLEKGSIRIYFAPRLQNHFHVLDGTVIVEERHPSNKASQWHYRENTWMLADEEAGEFLDLANNMNQLFEPSVGKGAGGIKKENVTAN